MNLLKGKDYIKIANILSIVILIFIWATIILSDIYLVRVISSNDMSCKLEEIDTDTFSRITAIKINKTSKYAHIFHLNQLRIVKIYKIPDMFDISGSRFILVVAPITEVEDIHE